MSENNGWRSMDSAPKSGEYLVYQPQTKAGRMALQARICLKSQAGFVRECSHWFPLPPPPETHAEA